MKKYIIIKADFNDADYVTEKTEITDDQIEIIKTVVKAIKNSKEDCNWGSGEYCETETTPNEQYIETGILTQQQVDLFQGFVPCCEYGIHTIETVDILVVQEEISLL